MARILLLVLICSLVVKGVICAPDPKKVSTAAPDAAKAAKAGAAAAMRAAATTASVMQPKTQSPAIAYFAKALMDVPIGIIELCKDTAEGLEKMMVTCVHGIFGNPKK